MLDTLADLLPLHGVPVDFVNVHARGLLFGKGLVGAGFKPAPTKLFGGAEQPGGPEEQEQEQDGQCGDILECRAEKYNGKGLRDTEENAADKRA